MLTGDPEWLRSSLQRYYDVLDELVVLVPEDGLGWAGRPIPVADCLRAVAEVDVRGIARVVSGSWVDRKHPIEADTAQRQVGLQQLSDCDWALQIDNDELLPDVSVLLAVLKKAPAEVVAVDWPMRVLYRRLRHQKYLAIAADSGQPVYEYPGPIAVRPNATLVNARRIDPSAGDLLRCVVPDDSHSLEVLRPPAPRERRALLGSHDHAIVHNSWGRSPTSVWRKIRTWGHSQGMRSVFYYLSRWLPAPLVWRWQRDLHPFARGLWPRLAPFRVDPSLLDATDLDMADPPR